MKIEQVIKLSPVERFIYWVRERENIRKLKEVGRPRPWTDDKILDTYRFCNVRRMDDKVSKWLLENWYKPYFNHPDMLQAVALARFINLPHSLAHIKDAVFIHKTPNWSRVKDLLRMLKQQGTIFNSAYMVRGNDGQDKISSVVDYYVAGLRDVEIDPTNMEETHARISQCYGMGSFMAGQIVADLRWAVEGTWEDKLTWAPIGPGSKRGMNRVQGRAVDTPIKQWIFVDELRELVKTCKEELPRSITSRLEAQDWQSCCCEVDKYNRVLFGEGKPKQLYRSST